MPLTTAEWRLLEWPAERERWLDLVELAFAAKGTPRAYFARHLDLSRDADAPLILVAFIDSVFVSTLRVFRLQQRFDGKQYEVGGIGEVCTHPEFRGKGYSSMLLDQAVGVMQQHGLHYSVLHAAEPLRSFYERAGWCITLQAVRFVEFPVVSIAQVSNGTARAANRTDIPKLHEIWTQFSEGRLDGIQSRDLDRWAQWSWAELAEIGTLYVWENTDGEVSGYCSMMMKRGIVQCRELGIVHGAPSSVLKELMGVMAVEVFGNVAGQGLGVSCPRGALQLGDLQCELDLLQVSEDCGFLIHPLGRPMPASVTSNDKDIVSYPSDGF